MRRPRLPEQLREAVAHRAQHCCEYCLSQADFSPDPFSIEHIVPFRESGEHDPSNLALACQGCNGRKYTSVEAPDPITGSPTPLYNPRQHQWRDHFAWSADFSEIVGVSATGRATVARLALNRTGVVNLRRALRITGDHPPGSLRPSPIQGDLGA